LRSTVVVGAGKVVAAGDAGYSAPDAGMIIDVVSDVDNASLRAEGGGGWGRNGKLHAGRNFIPVSAFKSGVLRFDFADDEVPTAAIEPAMVNFHLVKGGVAYQQVRILKTVTVMGRVVDANGKPLGTALVANHVGRTASEMDGFFAMEMSEKDPEVTLRHPALGSCKIDLQASRYPREGGTLMVGDVSCAPLIAQAPLRINQE
jgi:hypothetical protein